MDLAPKIARLGTLAPADPTRRRPIVALDAGHPITVEGLRIGPLIDEKAVHVTASWEVEHSLVVTCGAITLRRLDLGPVTLKTPGNHIDTVLVNGADPGQPAPDVLIEDVFAHDTNTSGVSFLVKDGHVGRLTLRRVELVNHVAPVILYGPIDSILIDGCPGLHVRLQGPPGSIGPVTVRNSPGIDIANAKDAGGIEPGAIIAFELPPTLEERVEALEAKVAMLLLE